MTEANINMKPENNLEDYVAGWLSKSQPDALASILPALINEWRGHVQAVLFYGSCLKIGELENQVLDFYILVDGYRTAYDSWLMAAANRILPPNVFYREFDHDGRVLRCKVAVISLADFERRSRLRVSNISVWARFSQPSALVYSQNDESSERVKRAIANCIRSMVSAALPAMSEDKGAEALWVRALSLTYGAELRSEGAEAKAHELYENGREDYERLMPHLGDLSAMNEGPDKLEMPGRGFWFRRRVNGKIVSLLRLAKAVFTFDGGVEYLAWKIERHSGIKVELTAWQRRHPILSAPYLFIMLRRRGAFR